VEISQFFSALESERIAQGHGVTIFEASTLTREHYGIPFDGSKGGSSNVDNFIGVEHDEDGMEVTNSTLPNMSTLKN
jgi:hypothetical protein